jgi:hypothetical protein
MGWFVLRKGMTMAMAFNAEGRVFYVPDDQLKWELTPEAIAELNKLSPPSEVTASGDVRAYGWCNVVPDRTRARDICTTTDRWARGAAEKGAETAGKVRDYFFKPYR